MNNSAINHQGYYKYFFILGMLLFSFGLNWSMFLVSLSIIIMAASLIVKIEIIKPFVSIYTKWGYDFKLLFKDPIYLILIFVFLVNLISGLWSEEKPLWIWFTRMMLPFLFLPMVMIRIGTVPRKWIHGFWLLCISSIFFTSIWILFDYIQHSQEINEFIMKGGAVKTPISHIRYSIIIACSILILMQWIVKKEVFAKKFERWIYIFLFIYFIIFIHIISVKSGIIGLYIGLFIYWTFYLLKNKKVTQWLAMIITLFLLSFAAYNLVPSLKSKVAYTVWQYSEWQKGKWLYYSDIERLVSIQMGLEIVKNFPISGTGIGDIEQVTKDTYYECLNHKEIKYAHNQFIFSWAACGLLGLLSIFGLVYIAFRKSNWNFPLVLGIQGILISSFLWEMTLETQMGTCIYLYFTITSYLWMKGED